MKYQEIIDEIKESAIQVSMSVMTIMASKIVGICLYRYENKYCTDDDIKIKKNPLGQKNPSTSEMNKFTSYYDGLITGINDEYIMSNIDQDQLERLIESWSLRTLDLEMLKKYDKTVIDLSEDQKKPFIDYYTVWNGDKIALETSIMNEAKKAIVKHPSYKVTNSKGNPVIFKDETKPAPPSAEVAVICAGAKIVCSNVYIYEKVDDRVPARLLNGVFYLFDGIRTPNGRYAICKKVSDVSVKLGYIRETDVIAIL